MVEYIELKSEGKKRYISGYISTVDPDFFNDIVTKAGQERIKDQLNQRIITMDLDHEEWLNDERKLNKFPIAKIVEVKTDDKGTWVKAELNLDYPDIDKIINMIESQFLHSYSIAYKVINPIYKIIDNIKYRIIDNLTIFNVGITGNPVNDNARINLKSYKKMEDYTEVIEDISEKVSNNISSLIDEKLSELKSINDEQTKSLEIKSKIETENLELKSKIESLQTKLTETENKLSEYENRPYLKSMLELNKNNREIQLWRMN